MTKEKKSLLTISTLMQVIFAFFDIFFGVYVYDISQNLNIIILYTMINAVVFLIALLYFFKFLNKKLLSVLYKVSFIMSVISIALTFTIDISRIYMVFITQVFLKLTHVCYYLPHEVATMTTNKRSQMRGFLGLSSTLSLVSGLIGPLLSGVIIDYASYYLIFGILLALSLVCFIVSFNVQIVKEDCERYGLINFVKESHKIKGVSNGYLSHMFYNLSNDGIVHLFLPIFLITYFFLINYY